MKHIIQPATFYAKNHLSTPAINQESSRPKPVYRTLPEHLKKRSIIYLTWHDKIMHKSPNKERQSWIWCGLLSPLNFRTYSLNWGTLLQRTNIKVQLETTGFRIRHNWVQSARRVTLGKCIILSSSASCETVITIPTFTAVLRVKQDQLTYSQCNNPVLGLLLLN